MNLKKKLKALLKKGNSEYQSQILWTMLVATGVMITAMLEFNSLHKASQANMDFSATLERFDQGSKTFMTPRRGPSSDDEDLQAHAGIAQPSVTDSGFKQEPLPQPRQTLAARKLPARTHKR